MMYSWLKWLSPAMCFCYMLCCMGFLIILVQCEKRRRLNRRASSWNMHQKAHQFASSLADDENDETSNVSGTLHSGGESVRDMRQSRAYAYTFGSNGVKSSRLREVVDYEQEFADADPESEYEAPNRDTESVQFSDAHSGQTDRTTTFGLSRRTTHDSIVGNESRASPSTHQDVANTNRNRPVGAISLASAVRIMRM
jgi:hypothetical protein